MQVVQRRDPAEPRGALDARFGHDAARNRPRLLEDEPLDAGALEWDGVDLRAARRGREHSIREPETDVQERAGADRFRRKGCGDLGCRNRLRVTAARCGGRARRDALHGRERESPRLHPRSQVLGAQETARDAELAETRVDLIAGRWVCCDEPQCLGEIALEPLPPP